jgi:flagellar motility protein MotE (MotC chaperone)
MMRILPVLAFLAFASIPLVLGNAETSEKPAATDKTADKAAAKTADGKDAVTASKDAGVKTETADETPVHKASSECLASEEVIQDLEAREQKLKHAEEALREREKELTSQQAAIKEEVSKLEAARAETQGVHAKELAEREEKVNKLMETFETMSPKSAAAVIGGVDDELAVMALSRLTSIKAGKIMSNLKPDQSSRLSELMAFGKIGKEKNRGESSNRAPASKQ